MDTRVPSCALPRRHELDPAGQPARGVLRQYFRDVVAHAVDLNRRATLYRNAGGGAAAGPDLEAGGVAREADLAQLALVGAEIKRAAGCQDEAVWFEGDAGAHDRRCFDHD